MSQQDEVEALLALQEASIQRAFREFLSVFRSGPVHDVVMQRLENGDIEGALKIVDSHIVRLGGVLASVQLNVGTVTMEELAGLLGPSPIAVTFNPADPRAAQILHNNQLRFVRDFSDQQRRAVQQAMNRAYLEGEGTQATARAFRDAIGLTPYQEQVVANYRQLLQSRDRAALERALRDRRFDSTIASAIERNRPLTERQIETMTARYRARMLAMRSETIARTEGVRATSEAREEARAQMIEQTGIAPSRVIRIWNATRDKRTRDWHRSMNGQEQPEGQPFVDGLGNRLRWPGDPQAPGASTINCRCALTFRVSAA